MNAGSLKGLSRSDTPSYAEDRCPKNCLADLAKRYRRASGEAFSVGDDVMARRLREAAIQIESLASTLVPLQVMKKSP